MQRGRRHLWLLALAVAGGVAWGGPAPESCRTNDQGENPSGCELESDVFVWAQGDPDYEIRGRITGCNSCSDPDENGLFTLDGDIQITFGPYANCSPQDGDVGIGTGLLDVLPGEPIDEEPTYVPRNPSQAFLLVPFTPFNTRCVAGVNADLEIPALELTGADGAVAIPWNGVDPSWGAPPSILLEEFGAPTRRVTVPPGFRVSQTLGLEQFRVEPPGSTLRIRPEGLPFWLGPARWTFGERLLRLDFDPIGGPTPYAFEAPDASNLAANQVETCLSGLCTAPTVHNLGYFDAAWEPGDGAVDNAGMDVSLQLGASQVVGYQTAFPSRLQVELEGPAQIEMTDGRIESGTFSDGELWLLASGIPESCDVGTQSRMQLNDGSLRPQIGPDGSLLAGITDLQGTTFNGNQPEEIRWSFNEVRDLGCGTLYVPSGAPGNRPVDDWYASAVETVTGRGLYAGVNYNNNKVCTAGDQPTGLFCITDADCEDGATCQDGGFAPLCPAGGPAATPLWEFALQDTQQIHEIDPNAVGTADREMVFVARRSGITGVFDKGDDAFPFGDGVTDFSMDFTRFGHAFLGSAAERGDTIIEGTLNANWPTDARLPFEELKLCNCGYYDKAEAPDILLDKTLAYWQVKFNPYGLNFSNGNKDTACDLVGETSCDQKAEAVCVVANVPIARFEPEFTGLISLEKNGEAGKIEPVSVSRFDFDRAVVDDVDFDPYAMDVEEFDLSDWDSVNGPQDEQAIIDGFFPYGFYNANGEFDIPAFG